MKKYLLMMVAVTILLALFLGVSANAATQGNGDVSFSVQATQELTASNIVLGTLSAGISTTSQTPVTLSSNVAWNVTAIASGDFSDGAIPTTLAISNLKMGGSTMVKTLPAVNIASGGATASNSPGISTEMTVPWDRADLVGKNLATTITYTITP